MTNHPDLPIFLSDLAKDREKIERLKKKLSNKRYVHIGPTPEGSGKKERQLWDHKHQELNPAHYQYDREISNWQKRISEREKTVLAGLCEIFRQFECEYADWESLASKLMETQTYRSSGLMSAYKLRRVKGRSPDDWRGLALELMLANELFTVEPVDAKSADRTADMKLAIALMMDACLTPHPETGRPASPSVAQAADAVYAKLIRMAEADNSTPEEIEGIPRSGSIRTLYYRVKNSMRGEDDGPVIRFSSRLQQKIKMDQALFDLERIAVLWAYMKKSKNN